MSMLNFFQNVADQMRSKPSEIDKRLDALDEKYGTNALSFIQDQFQPAQAAPMIDSANLMAQTNSAAGVANPAAMMLQSNATTADMSTPALFDPRANNQRGGMLEDAEEETEQERLLRESYEAVQPVPQVNNNAVQPLNLYG